ncbi:MAG TPA: DUF6114 domain-containing protein [Pseudonocardiaceae bacterium]|nr:DUF6114 domain-containing protein [Pseudonocardiaceae bacterium]
MLIAFRKWRRTRPFWGGLLITAGATEILSTTVLSLGPTFRVGLGGVNAFVGVIITVVLGLCGLLLWFSPAQRVFYAIVSMILALATFNTINYGGFFLGMLLGLVGGAMAFAWSDGPVRVARPGPRSADRKVGSGSARARLTGGWFWRQGQSRGSSERERERILTIAAVPLAGLLLLAPALPAQPAGHASAHSSPGCILIILCPPTPSPTPSPTPTRSPGPSHKPSPSPSATSPGGSHPSPSPSTPAGSKGKTRGKVKKTAAPPRQVPPDQVGQG